ncbi:semaphorin-5B [Tribolium castaneum]|uniref:semaphorin-5B n=1 Tax=Tribolium castaneum TaxID=7070 RepID=UPI0030FF2001
MVPHGPLNFLLCLSIFLTLTLSAEHDFRYISFQDLQQSLNKFSQDEVVSYSQMLFDVARNQVLVGARDVLFRLSLTKLELLESAEWPASTDKRIECINKGQSDEFCHNYIKILLTNGKNLFVCGTNAFSPQCSTRKIENVSDVTEWVDGLAKCPYNPAANITGFMSERGEYYFGGPTDFSSSDFVFSKNVGTVTIRTKQYNSFLLNDPQFVGTFETENFVYFLFRETAVEYMNCGKTIYSRIARVCKNDPGGHTMLKDNWTTFLKARLNCSVSGEYPFYFDEIQSMAYVPDENMVYATFTTPSNSIAGSAICAFNLSSIEAAFAGPFKYRENMDSAWGQYNVHHRDHFNCKSSPRSSHLLETSKYQLMDSAVQATTLNPLHVAQLERFTHITIDVLSTKIHTSVHVIYVSTTTGVIKKISVLPRTQETCVVEIWQTVQNPATPVKSIQFLKATKSIYVATEHQVMKIPAEHCSRHTSKTSCLNAMDPYCGWNERYENCSTAPNADPLDKYWKQAVTTCPILDTVVDGGWSSWSPWAPCVQRSAPESDADTCLCQVRECNNPAPKNGGLPCGGPAIAVTNCTVHGGWSVWSAWSACSATCGTAVKTRSRTCTNPAPAHGGRVCVGQDRTEAFCDAEIPPCPAMPQDGGWGEWSDWGDCSPSHCSGCKRRTRVCNNPPPENGGQFCAGNDEEFKFECPEHRKTVSTPWISLTNSSGDYNKRFRCTCKAPVKMSLIKVAMKEEVCNNDNCFTKDSEHPKWSAWGPWGECSVQCGGGLQNRTRYCEGIGCTGPSVQTRECNKHHCREWGCWSEWSPCNASCGWGVKTRHRVCLGSNCSGHDWEKEPCQNAPCESVLGWSNWTSWSVCDKNNEQHRQRQCRTLNPGPNMCQGSSVETRMCIPEQLSDVARMASESPQLASPGGAILFLFLGIVIGLVSGVGGTHYYHKKRRIKIPSSPHYMSPKQNPYITMPLQDRSKKHSASTSNNLLNNGTLKSKYCSDYESATLKRNSHTLNNGHVKQDLLDDDKYYYD